MRKVGPLGVERAALIYLHATTEQQRKLADSLGMFIEEEWAADQDASGTDVARDDQEGTDITRPRSAGLG
jgi:hypothetical protein